MLTLFFYWLALLDMPVHAQHTAPGVQLIGLGVQLIGLGAQYTVLDVQLADLGAKYTAQGVQLFLIVGLSLVFFKHPSSVISVGVI